jgi:N-methylhydantoinase A
MSTTVMNAATKTIMSAYLDRLQAALADSGFGGQVLIMQSNGGVMSAVEAKHRPVATLMSGPVGGVAASINTARDSESAANLLTLDMGGTSADVALIDNGEALTRTVGQIGGWPVMVPMIDIHTIGAGGGSIARVDRFGSLRVGPESAGAVPGPACYRNGGRKATVTDANLVLGRINPEYFLGGSLQLGIAEARRALDEHVGAAYGMTTEEAAEAVVTVVNSTMVRLLWEVMIARGMDPREFSLLAFGGAGPLHACELAQALGMTEVIVPAQPGTFSAYGMIAADVRHDHEQMMVGHTNAISAAEVDRTYRLLEGQARRQAEQDAVAPEPAAVELVRTAEVRYSGQQHALSVELNQAPLTDLEGLRELFEAKHERLYGFRRDDTDVEVLRLQVSSIARVAAPSNDDHPTRLNHGEPESFATRQLFIRGEKVDVPVFRRSDVPRGATLTGPTCIEESGSTTYLPLDSTLRVDERGQLRIALAHDAAQVWV